MQRVVLCLTVSLALVFSASLGVDAASAADRSQNGADASAVRSGAALGAGQIAAPVASQTPAPRRRVTTTTVKRFIRRQARIVTKHQPAVFPSARITAKTVIVVCGQPLAPRLWECVFSIGVYEESTIDPPTPYDPQWPIRQSTLRWCDSRNATNERFVKVRLGRNRMPSTLRLVGKWRMSCELGEFAIDLWNTYGPDWQPNVTEPTPYTPVTLPVPKGGQMPDDLPPPPTTDPVGPPPGPMPRRYGSASRIAHSAEDTFLGCSPYAVRYWNDPRFWVYFCFWRLHSLPGASPGIFNNVTQYDGYYYWGNDAYGQPIWRFFLTGTY
jgi:hypothetical protein